MAVESGPHEVRADAAEEWRTTLFFDQRAPTSCFTNEAARTDGAPLHSHLLTHQSCWCLNDVAEEEHSGSGQAEDSDRNGADSGDQQQQDDGMADEMADGGEGPQAGNGDESDGMWEEDDDNDQDDDIDDRDSDDDWEYEEEGHPLSDLADPTAPVPDGHIGLDELEARFPEGTSDATRELSRWIIGRRITDARQVTDLIEQDADPDVITGLVGRGSSGAVYGYSLLAIAIDNKSGYTIRTVKAEDSHAVIRPVALPQWSSDELQAAILTALLDGGADPNAAAGDLERIGTPLQVAIAYGNQTAFEPLMARQDIDLRVLMSMYERLARRDPTLATERVNGGNLVHRAAFDSKGLYPQSFIDSYLDLITANGADMTAEDDLIGEWPLDFAAVSGSPQVADFLCRKLPADQIDRRNYHGDTPIVMAARQLDWYTQRLQDPGTPEQTKERHRAEIPNYKLTIHSLLRAGADINLIPTATEDRRRGRQLVLTEYATVLNQLPTAVMAAVNAALAPHRSLAALLTPRLAVGPQEAPIFGWRIASYLFDMDAAQQAITEEASGVRHTDMARRVCAAAEHFIRSAVYQASSNREVVGGTADVGGQVVRVPQLQCFVLEGVDSRPREAVHTRGRVGLREVVHRARLDEAAKWGLADGAVAKGFNTHLGDADCKFTWQQLGAAFQ
ncbi:unnamed protein product [Vitrella brassicaformis CCMP3155]|uniref:Uncharacterized protein n=1 Tax=Vitrella brassicaformis (strain CCMP3155) TaxID=1169540 RepID=A0A0G4EDF4_VITBC|nr:unnamed protein product [Vitrella brassicaformis CCMP3155]|eukprot:CEL93386.1 unnamed protein product [Vitrella brassicaformis CCMP3155]